MSDKQIKSRRRVRDYGEVFTPPEIVSDMVDLADKGYEETGEQDAWHILTRRYLEPACGTGNFLVEVLRRKLAVCETPVDACITVSTLYGVDILEDNVLECRDRLAAMVYDRFGRTEQMEMVVGYFLRRNIVAGNSLTGRKNDGTPIWFLAGIDQEIQEKPPAGGHRQRSRAGTRKREKSKTEGKNGKH